MTALEKKAFRACKDCGSRNVDDWTAYYWMPTMKRWLCMNCIYKKRKVK